MTSSSIRAGSHGQAASKVYYRGMGHPEQFVQRTFAEETERITGGAAGWQDSPEIRLEEVQRGGYFVIRRPQMLAHLAAPWPEAQPHDEVMIELTLAGNRLDRGSVERALFRRQARQVQRLEEQDASWRGEEPLWLAASHLPEWLDEMRRPVRFAPGCYWIDPQPHSFLWIAANELPLRDELIPFLMARSGQALDEFVRWVVPPRPFEWVLTILDLEYRPMSMPTRQELLWRFRKTDDPEIEARRQHILEVLLEAGPQTQRQHILDVLLEASPQTQQQLIEKGQLEGRLTEARAALRRVLARRQLTPSKDDDARIEACADLATLERWLDRAVTAISVSDALG
jgi:hypothetical protein